MDSSAPDSATDPCVISRVSVATTAITLTWRGAKELAAVSAVIVSLCFLYCRQTDAEVGNARTRRSKHNSDNVRGLGIQASIEEPTGDPVVNPHENEPEKHAGEQGNDGSALRPVLVKDLILSVSGRQGLPPLRLRTEFEARLFGLAPRQHSPPVIVSRLLPTGSKQLNSTTTESPLGGRVQSEACLPR